mgnify:CR=1 FL=1
MTCAQNADKLGKSPMEVKWLDFWLANYSTSPNIGDYSGDSTKNKHSSLFKNICFVLNLMKQQLPGVDSFCLNIWNAAHQIPFYLSRILLVARGVNKAKTYNF